jgi:hypothetical protein
MDFHAPNLAQLGKSATDFSQKRVGLFAGFGYFALSDYEK